MIIDNRQTHLSIKNDKHLLVEVSKCEKHVREFFLLVNCEDCHRHFTDESLLSEEIIAELIDNEIIDLDRP